MSSLPATSGLISVLGFGYDNNKKDHRVVKISYSRFDNNKGFNPLVEVYSVWERIWKTIPADYLADNSISSVSFSHCFLNGVIHWLAFETGPFNYVAKWVLLFNVVEETFQKMELPEAIVKMLTTCTGTPDLFEYKTKLSLLHCEDFECHMSTFAKCQIWVKEEEESCWCMILNITVDDDHYLLSQVAYLDKDGKLFGFYRKSDRVMVLYDVSKRQFIELGFHYSYDASSKFASFTDSLVLLDQDTTDLTKMMHSKCTSTHLQLEMN
ncbi:uncharacterized protein LOC141636064 [Silene latifolia]|uniref:uncharacterized protein LOC141636064 n=1 Tax=Silene latifolia TaxID=37657 RepID=UPI003D7737DE